MFDRTKRPTSRPDSDRSSHPASAQGAHHGRWTWVVGLVTSYYGLKNDTQNMFFSCSWNYHYLPPVSDASANLLAYIFIVTCHSLALELMFSRFEYQLNTWWQLWSDLPCFQSSIWLWTKCVSSAYGALQDKPYISVPKTSQFQSGPRVVKMVLNTQCYLYLWLTMWFHAKKSKETLKNKIANFTI